MSLTDLVKMVRQRTSKSRGAGELPLHESARQVLLERFGVAPTANEVEELLAATEMSFDSDCAFFEDWSPEDDFPHGLQNRGGRRVVHKSEPMAG